MAGFGSTPTTGEQADLAASQFPISAVAVPDKANGDLTASKGGPEITDVNGNVLAAAAVYIYDGENVAQGHTTDAAWSGSGAASQIALLKKIIAELAATLSVSGSVSVSNLPSIQRVDAQSGDFPTGAIADLATLLTLSGTPTDANTANSLMGRLTKIRDLLNSTITVSGAVTTSGTVTEANSSAINVHLANIDSDAASLVTNTTGLATHSDAATLHTDLATTNGDLSTINTSLGTLATQTTAAAMKSDLDTLVTNTNKIPASPAQEGGNLATVATNTGNAATGIGGVADAAVTNPASSGSAIALLKGLLTRIGSTFGFDNTSRLQTSLYGKNSTAGDTAIKVNSSGDQYMLGDFTEQASLSAGSLNADLVASTDVSAYKWLSLHINTNAYVGTLTFQASNDNVNFTSVLMTNEASGALTTTLTTTTNVLYERAVTFRYFRVRMTAYTSGAAQATLEQYTQTAPNMGVQANQAGNWNINIRDTGASTLNSNGGALNVSHAHSNATVPANTAGNVVIRASAGVLAVITVTTLGTAALSFYDNASTNSGTILHTVPASAPVGTIYTLFGAALNGIVAAGVTNCPGLTVYYC